MLQRTSIPYTSKAHLSKKYQRQIRWFLTLQADTGSVRRALCNLCYFLFPHDNCAILLLPFSRILEKRTDFDETGAATSDSHYK